MKRVPQYPTEKMVRAAMSVQIELTTHGRPFDYADCWRAMYTAAPDTPGLTCDACGQELEYDVLPHGCAK